MHYALIIGGPLWCWTRWSCIQGIFTLEKLEPPRYVSSPIFLCVCCTNANQLGSREKLNKWEIIVT